MWMAAQEVKADLGLMAAGFQVFAVLVNRSRVSYGVTRMVEAEMMAKKRATVPS